MNAIDIRRSLKQAQNVLSSLNGTILQSANAIETVLEIQDGLINDVIEGIPVDSLPSEDIQILKSAIYKLRESLTDLVSAYDTRAPNIANFKGKLDTILTGFTPE